METLKKLMEDLGISIEDMGKKMKAMEDCNTFEEIEKLLGDGANVPNTIRVIVIAINNDLTPKDLNTDGSGIKNFGQAFVGAMAMEDAMKLALFSTAEFWYAVGRGLGWKTEGVMSEPVMYWHKYVNLMDKFWLANNHKKAGQIQKERSEEVQKFFGELLESKK